MARLLVLFLVILSSAFEGQAQTTGPLTLIQTIQMSDVPTGPSADHLGVDVKGHRLFATMQAHKTVAVLDLDTGKLIQNIPAGNPHAVLYRSDLDQIYVSDGDPALPGLTIFSGRDYHLIKSVKSLQRADMMQYDPDTKYLYVVNAGPRGELEDQSVLSVVDTTAGDRVADIKISAGLLEDMVLERSSPRLYINLTDRNAVGVVDRQERTLLETWPITKGNTPVAIALDETHRRLFVGCQNTDMTGVIVVFDTQTGKELRALALGGLVDYLGFDPQSGRLYATCGTGYIYVYQEQDPDNYALIGKVETAVMTKCGLLVPQLNRLFAVVPHLNLTQAKILVFRTQ
jgi:DNA-binding beta-propeller fold protein YncE